MNRSESAAFKAGNSCQGDIQRKSTLFLHIASLSITFYIFLNVGSLALASDYEIVQSDTHHFEINQGTLLQLRLGSGSLNIRTWDRQDITIRVRRWAKAGSRKKAEEKLRDIEIEFDVKDDGLRIHELGRGDSNPFKDLLRSTGLGKGESTRVDFDITVPVSIGARVSKVGGETWLKGIDGNVEVEQKKGSLYLSDFLSDRLELKLDDVSAEILNIKGNNGGDSYINITIDKGQINMQNSNVLRLIARSKKADVYLVNNDIKSGDIKTDSGDLFFNSELTAYSRIKAFSDSGTMYLLLPDSPQSQINAETGIGVIRCSHEWSVKKAGSGYILNYGTNQSNKGECNFVSEIGDIFIQPKWK